jgi:RNA polymerase sigma factor (sigma-70 family)
MTACDLTQIVTKHHEELYRFAFSLTGAEAAAKNLTQQTFYIWSIKGHQLRDSSKVKSWLYTTLRREFLKIRRIYSRFEHSEGSDEDQNVADISTELVGSLDAARLIELLEQVKEPYRSAAILFYTQDFSYKEMAGILEVPMGAVRSCVARGVSELQRLINKDSGRPPTGPYTAECGSGIDPG